MDKGILNLTQASKYCLLGREALLKHINKGELKASKGPYGHYRIYEKDLISFMHDKGMFPMASYLPKNKKILVVDDEAKILKVLEKRLSKDGYLIETASDGAQAADKMMKFLPGLVVLDLFMPAIDGFELCKQIKKSHDTSHIKVLAITGYDSKKVREKILKAGADNYLAKPLSSKSLLSKVKILLKEKTD